MTYRDGDKVLVLATVKHSRDDRGARVEFKTALSLPLDSVEVERVKEYVIRPGDRIRVPGRGVSPLQGTVKAVVTDIATPQVVYLADDNYVLQVMDLSSVERLRCAD